MREPEQFEDAFRRWAARPITSGAEAAAKVFAPRERRPRGLRLSPAWATLAAAALVITSVATWLVETRVPVPRVDSVGSRLAAPAPDSDVVVLWLDDQTPVHVFLTEASARGVK